VGAYGAAWPLVHQQLGVRPDLGRGRLEVVPQPPGADPIGGTDIRLGADGSVDVSARHTGRTFTTTVSAHAPVRLRIGATLPAGAEVREVRLDGRRVSGDERVTNRGREVTVAASPGERHTLVVTTR
jgi:choline dehydrogenase-like flavoprotein